MQRKVDSIVDRIRNVEKRLMDNGFVGGLSEWNPLLELQARLQVRESINDGDHTGWYVALPTKDCIYLLNALSKVTTKQESEYYLSLMGTK